jgi:2TM domain-containing protein
MLMIQIVGDAVDARIRETPQAACGTAAPSGPLHPYAAAPGPYSAASRAHVVPDAKCSRPSQDRGMTTTTEEHDEVLATTRDALREQALDRLKKRRDFKAHLLVYTLVNLAIWGVWVVIAASSGGSWPWPVFLTLFWGIGLAMNAWDVYFRRPITEQELDREIDRLQGSH